MGFRVLDRVQVGVRVGVRAGVRVGARVSGRRTERGEGAAQHGDAEQHLAQTAHLGRVRVRVRG